MYLIRASDMNLRSGLCGSYAYPDRLFVASEPPVATHYDTIFLCEKLFGNPFGHLSSNEDTSHTAFGWLPSMQVETGPLDDYMTDDAHGRSPGVRPLTEKEILLVGKICTALCNFVKFQKSNRSSKYEVFEDTYRVDLCNEESSVKVSYNMDKENGGLGYGRQVDVV